MASTAAWQTSALALGLVRGLRLARDVTALTLALSTSLLCADKTVEGLLGSVLRLLLLFLFGLALSSAISGTCHRLPAGPLGPPGLLVSRCLLAFSMALGLSLRRIRLALAYDLALFLSCQNCIARRSLVLPAIGFTGNLVHVPFGIRCCQCAIVPSLSEGCIVLLSPHWRA